MDDERLSVLLDDPRRREAAHGSDDSAISALRRKRRSAILRRRVAVGLKAVILTSNRLALIVVDLPYLHSKRFNPQPTLRLRLKGGSVC